MKTTILIALTVADLTVSLATASIPAANIKWNGHLGASGDPKSMFCLMARGLLQMPTSPEMPRLIAAWLRDHPKAVAIRVASFDIDPEKRPGAKMVYVWIIDGKHNLNLELVRQGCFDPRTLTIMPEIPGLELPGQKLEAPQADYDAFVQKALDVGKQAKEKKLGIWKSSAE